MKRIIVTHLKPDLDALTSVWLVHRFWPNWAEAEVRFVPAGSGYQPKEEEEVVVVDTGGGKFDHHQAAKGEELTSAAALVLAEIKRQKWLKEGLQPLERLVTVVTEIDNFRELKWPEAAADYHLFSLAEIIDAWSLIYHSDYLRVAALAEMSLDAVYLTFKNKVRAEAEISKGQEVSTPWGKGLVLATANGAVEHLAQKMGYAIVIRQDPKKGNLRIVGRWDKGVDLSEWYRKLKSADPQATWFLHNSKCMLLNGAGSNNTMKPTKLKLAQILELLNINAPRNRINKS